MRGDEERLAGWKAAAEAKAAKAAGVQRFLAQPGVTHPIADPHLTLDTTKPLDDLVAQTLAWLDRLNAEEAEGAA